MRITADGGQAAGEIGRVEGGITKLTAAEFNAAGGAAGLEKAFQKTGAAAVKGAAGVDQFSKAAARGRMATQQMGMQINDFATQIALGGRPMQAFAAQAGQMGWAMSQMEGKAKSVGLFLAGPWGAALVLATTFLGSMVTALWNAKKGNENLSEAAKISKMTIEELTDAIRENQKALDKAVLSGREKEKQELHLAELHRLRALELRKLTVALLEHTKAEFEAAQGQSFGAAGGAGAGMATAMAGRQVVELEKQLALANLALAAAQREVNTALVPIIQRGSKRRTDPAEAIQGRFEDASDALAAAVAKGTKTVAQARAEMDKLNLTRAAEIKALQESRKQHGDPTLPKVTGAEVAAILKKAFGGGTATSGIRSAQHNRDVGGAANSYHLTGQAVDFVPPGGMRNFNKATARSALEAVGIKVLELLGPGDKGHEDHGHVAFARQRLGPDQVAAAQEREARAAEAAQRKADALAAFGDRAATTIANMGARGGGMTTFETWKKDFETLNALADELSKKKPPDWKELAAAARETADVLRDGIQKPYKDFIADQVRSLGMERLVNAGHADEAEALGVVADLEERIGLKLLPAQVAAVRAVIQARKAEAREADIARQKQEKYLDAIRSTRDAFRGIFDLSGQGLKDLPKKLGDMVGKLVGDFLFDKLFGDIFNQLEDQVKGVTTVQDASVKMADAIADADAAIDNLGAAAQSAADKLNGVPSPTGGDTPPDSGGDIIVTGTRKKVAKDPAAFLADMLEKLAKGILGEKMAKQLGAIIGQALQGAAIGQMASNSILGERSKTGNIAASIGGALGGFAGKALGTAIGGPLGGMIGSALGSAAGGLLGGLLGGAKKAPKGSTTITNVYDAGAYKGSNSLKGNVNALASSVQGGILDIASQLGGGLGNFAVSVGYNEKKKKYVVDTAGLGRLKSGDDITREFSDETDAIAFAIMDAIKDGAVTGLSAAVQKALQSSPDAARALKEALQVQDVETLIGGLGSTMQRQFTDFEKAAKERVRIATKYGLDLVALEKINAEQRAKMFEDVLKSRIGALQDLLNDLNFGDLFEGTPAQKRQKLLGQIATTRTKAEAGDEGAADKLAELERQLVELSREAYGTAGPEYASDLAQARADAERVIALETDRAREAQERAIAQLNAATTQVQLTNETNNILSQILTTLGGSTASPILATGGGGGGGSYETGRLVNL